MKTNFQALLIIEKHYLEHKNEIHRGLLDEREVKLITEELSLKEKDLIQLQDARDFVVAYTSNALMKQELNGSATIDNSRIVSDMMSAITCVIDNEIINKGGQI